MSHPELLQPIDDALASLRGYAGQEPAQAFAELEELAQRVFVLAHQAGLAAALPDSAAMRAAATFEGMHPPALATSLNVPGDWLDGDAGRIFRPVLIDQWFTAMAALRALAAAAPAPADTTTKHPTEEVKERVLDVLTTMQRHIVEHLWDKQTGVTFRALESLPDAWRSGEPSDVIKKIKSINKRLTEAQIWDVSLHWSGDRVRLERPK